MKTTITVIVDTDTASVIPAVVDHLKASAATLLMVNEVEVGVTAAPLEGVEMPKLINTAPARIYLVVGEDIAEDTHFDDLFDSDVTWCADKIDANSIAYARADIPPRFQHTFCQACGKDCGPGDDGPIDCRGHVPDARKMVQPIADWQVQIMQDWEPRRLRLTIGVQSFDVDVHDDPDEPGRMEWYLAQLTGAMNKLTAPQPLAPPPGYALLDEMRAFINLLKGAALLGPETFTPERCRHIFEECVRLNGRYLELDAAAAPQPPASVQPLAVGVEALPILEQLVAALASQDEEGLIEHAEPMIAARRLIAKLKVQAMTAGPEDMKIYDAIAARFFAAASPPPPGRVVPLTDRQPIETAPKDGTE